MRKKVLLILPEKNFNEREFLAVKESLVKNHIAIYIASDAIGLCTGNNGMKVKADVKIFNIHPKNFDALVIPGGDGIREYADNQKIKSVLREFCELGKVIGAICAAPVLLANAGILESKEAVCFPSDQKALKRAGAIIKDMKVTSDKNIITAVNAETAVEFAEIFTGAVLSG